MRAGADASDSPASDRRTEPASMAPSTWTASDTRGGSRMSTSSGSAASTVNDSDAACSAAPDGRVRMVNRPGATPANTKRPSAAVVDC